MLSGQGLKLKWVHFIVCRHKKKRVNKIFINYLRLIHMR